MKKITENALLYRVNQLKEKMAMYEDTTLQAYNANLAKGMDKNAAWAAAQTASTTPASATPAQFPTPVKDWNAKVASQPTSTTARGGSTLMPPASNQIPASNSQANPAQPQGTAPKPSTTTPAGKWPTTPEEIKAFQKANKGLNGQPLKVDGLIGRETMQALAKAGIQPPAGFQMVGNKQHPAAHGQHATHQGGAAKPAAQGQHPAASPEDAARDARIQQNQAFYNLSPEDQAAINQAHGQQSLHTAASNNANAATQTAMTQGDTLSKAAAQAANAALPATPPSSASTAQGPLGINFQSQQPPQKPEGVTVYNESPEYVSFGQEDSLARIIQLARG